jgi:hypothetical protein
MASIRVHLAGEYTRQPAEFPGGYWDVSKADGSLTIVDDEDIPVARFQPGVWTWVETVKDGAA